MRARQITDTHVPLRPGHGSSGAAPCWALQPSRRSLPSATYTFKDLQRSKTNGVLLPAFSGSLSPAAPVQLAGPSAEVWAPTNMRRAALQAAVLLLAAWGAVAQVQAPAPAPSEPEELTGAGAVGERPGAAACQLKWPLAVGGGTCVRLRRPFTDPACLPCRRARAAAFLQSHDQQLGRGGGGARPLGLVQCQHRLHPSLQLERRGVRPRRQRQRG